MQPPSILRRRHIAALLTLACVHSAASADLIARTVLNPEHCVCPPANDTEREQLIAAYTPAGRTFWSSNASWSQAHAMVRTLQHADLFGLRPNDYCAEALQESVRELSAGSTSAESAERFEVGLSMASLRLILHLQRGRVSPRDAGFDLSFPMQRLDPAQALDELSHARDLTATLDRYEPRSERYRALKDALAQYRNLARQEHLTRLQPMPRNKLELGDSYGGAQQLRVLLFRLGDLPEEAAANPAELLDAPLVHAIKQFQSRHGLAPDGVIGAKTYAALTTPMSHRVRQIELTLERWRWLPPLQAPMIIINVPQFELFALPRTAQETVLEMPIIVGQAERLRRTPVFSAAVEQVVFQPYWDIPRSILVRELLPVIRRKPEYLQRNHMEIVAGETDRSPVLPSTPANIEALAAGRARLRQRPGPDNALGPVKFVLPNPYRVFLHGTPATELFSRPRRDFSHGCIRVADPAALAAYVLKDAPTEWSEALIEAALCGSSNQRVKLAKPIPILILYGTAFASKRRGMLFFDDIYGHDQKLQALLGLAPIRLSRMGAITTSPRRSWMKSRSYPQAAPAILVRSAHAQSEQLVRIDRLSGNPQILLARKLSSRSTSL
ncbi:MAG: L,D-transpeptidase family protein [Steroidobacteraceae bacterium]